VQKWNKDEIQIPKLQRKFVWTQIRASKLIESFLMGLPVPPVFFYQDRGTNKLLVVDGHQRLRSIVYFFAGEFGEPGELDSADEEIVFSLTGLSEKSPYFKATYAQLKDEHEAAFNKLNNSVLRSFVVKQINPKDDTSIFEIFERLNTGGVVLQGQEVRNCIYEGELNNLLLDLNKYASWRTIFGHVHEDKRMRDVELILRFFALFHDLASYEKPMKKFLNDFMRVNRRPSAKELQELKSLFSKTADAVLKYLGPKPFHVHGGLLNAAAYDSVFTAFAKNLSVVSKAHTSKTSVAQIAKRFKHLTQKDDAYLKLISSGTTDEDIVEKRIERAEKKLFG